VPHLPRVRLGVVIRPQSPPEAFPDLFQLADRSGIPEAWLWEDCFVEGGISSAATALAGTTQLTVGVGLLPVPLRNVALTAMEIATLDRIHPGRLTIAVGHGVQEWMEQVGARAKSPLTLMREYLIALRALLAGESVTMDGEYVRLRDVQLGWPPATPPRILMGATGPGSLRLAGEFADGVVIVEDTSPASLRDALHLVGEGRDRGDRTDAFETVVYLRAHRGSDAESQLRRDARPASGNYGIVLGEESVRAAVNELADAGATTVALVPAGDDPSVAAYLEEAAGILNAL
jgi:alkanesulfonate monooxygenase SsuD/methylene tetrahydromethanopterin reductase-like flavin-dependent oxidoreductase (luciferase family)